MSSVDVAGSLDLSRIDPSDCIDAMDANMSFSGRSGFRPVERLPAQFGR